MTISIYISNLDIILKSPICKQPWDVRNLKLDSFIDKRRENANFYLKSFSKLDEYFYNANDTREKANPSWFGFPITVRENVDKL